MPDLPRGTVSFLFADRGPEAMSWHQQDESLASAIATLDEAVSTHGGVVYKHTERGVQAAFSTATNSVLAAIAAQRQIQDANESSPAGLTVRMAVHTGAVDPQPDGDYRSPVLNRLGRLLDAAHGGQILLSQVATELVREALPDGLTLQDLGEHRLKDLHRSERVAQVSSADLPSDFPPLRTLSSIPNNLQAQPTAIIGRSDELAAAELLLQDQDVRIITLVGAGGSGKTRLAVQMAADHLDLFPDGVFFIDLSGSTRSGEVPDQIAQVLGVEDDPARSLIDGIGAWLASKRVLLVLDNLEQIEDIGPMVAELSSGSQYLRIIATSRSPLRVRGEREVPIEPLPVPNLRRLPRLDVLSQFDSVALFIDRARAILPSFAVTNATAPAIAEICVRLDGLPLAIELAAARSRLLPPQAMLDRLTKRLPLLIDGPRDLPLRHQTLRDTIAWSYELLPTPEQALFRRLAVFQGRAGLDAATAVACEGLEMDCLTGLEHLVRHSLLRSLDDTGTPAVTMLETIREFGLDLLTEAGELDAMRDRHARWFAELMREAFPQLLGQDQAAWFARLTDDQDNLTVALRWLIDAAPDDAVAMAADLWWFWYVRGHLRLARQQLDDALAAGQDTPSLARARALHGSATLAYVMGDSEVARVNGEAALAVNRLLGNERGISTNLNHLANVALTEDPARAQVLYDECLAVSERLGDDNLAAVAMLNLGSLATRHGDYATATERYRSALERFQQTGDLGSQAVTLANLGTVALLGGDDVQVAMDWLDQSRVIAQEIGDQVGMLSCLAGYAMAMSQAGQHEAAARLRGAVDAMREETGELEDPAMAELDRQVLHQAREALGAERFQALTIDGSEWSLETAFAEVERARRA